jgi:hypothetical protein
LAPRKVCPFRPEPSSAIKTFVGGLRYDFVVFFIVRSWGCFTERSWAPLFVCKRLEVKILLCKRDRDCSCAPMHCSRISCSASGGFLTVSQGLAVCADDASRSNSPIPENAAQNPTIRQHSTHADFSDYVWGRVSNVWPALWPCLSYGACACLLHITNKYLFSSLGFHFIFIFTSLQAFMTCAFIAGLAGAGFLTVARPSTALLARLAPVALLGVLNTVSGMKGLQHTNLPVSCLYWRRRRRWWWWW